MTAPAVADLVTGVRKGRPRDERIDQEITSAAVQELAESGFAAFSVGEVAARAGVAKTTVYRRFPAREDLIAAALERLNDDLPLVPTSGTVRQQLAVLLEGIRNRRPDSEWSRILMHAMREGADEANFAAMIHTCVLAPRHRVMRDVIEAGIASGELRADLDADTAIPILVGPMIYLSKQNVSSSLAHVSVEAVLDVILAGMTPASE